MASCAGRPEVGSSGTYCSALFREGLDPLMVRVTGKRLARRSPMDLPGTRRAPWFRSLRKPNCDHQHGEDELARVAHQLCGPSGTQLDAAARSCRASLHLHSFSSTCSQDWIDSRNASASFSAHVPISDRANHRSGRSRLGRPRRRFARAGEDRPCSARSARGGRARGWRAGPWDRCRGA